jgi:hypothetical protein
VTWDAWKDVAGNQSDLAPWNIRSQKLTSMRRIFSEFANMTKNKPIPVDSLYVGNAGELHIMAECFRSKMEAFKLPIDKGFDLVVTRAYSALSSIEAHLPPTAIYMQVKSLQATLKILEGQNQGWAGAFKIKIEDIDLLCRTPNSVLACVVFFNKGDSYHLTGRTAYSWWIPSNSLKVLRANDHFVATDDPDIVTLNVKYVEEAKNGSYISLMRQHHGKDALRGHLASGEILVKRLFDFDCLYSDPKWLT